MGEDTMGNIFAAAGGKEMRSEKAASVATAPAKGDLTPAVDPASLLPPEREQEEAVDERDEMDREEEEEQGEREPSSDEGAEDLSKMTPDQLRQAILDERKAREKVEKSYSELRSVHDREKTFRAEAEKKGQAGGKEGETSTVAEVRQIVETDGAAVEQITRDLRKKADGYQEEIEGIDAQMSYWRDQNPENVKDPNYQAWAKRRFDLAQERLAIMKEVKENSEALEDGRSYLSTLEQREANQIKQEAAQLEADKAAARTEAGVPPGPEGDAIMKDALALAAKADSSFLTPYVREAMARHLPPDKNPQRLLGKIGRKEAPAKTPSGTKAMDSIYEAGGGREKISSLRI